MRKLTFTFVALVTVAGSATAQTLDIVASPATAAIYKVKMQDNSLVLLGTGSAKVKLEKSDPNTIVVRDKGYRDATRSFPTGEKYKDKLYTIFLTRRVVELSVLPYDASVFVNGDLKGRGQLELEIEEGTAVTVEVRKSGFKTLSRTFRWDKTGGELPPPRERLELVDRQVSLTTVPGGSEIYKDDVKLGDGDANVVVVRGTCVTVRAQRPGWIPAERQYCNKEGMAEPVLSDRLTMSGRSVLVNAPTEAKVFVNQRQAGTGSVAVKINDGSCIQVRVEQPGFVDWNREYCAQDNVAALPLEQSITLAPDDSFQASEASVNANVSMNIPVAANRASDVAWRQIVGIVGDKFDELETIDSETGYLRTAWKVKTFGSGSNQVVIRTRVIVRKINDAPLRFSVKIVSERNKYAGISVKEDENFKEWDRILNTYKDLISELQSRLQ